MSFIKLVLCNESPQENKSSVWKMQILGNLAVKVGCQGNIVLTSTHDNCVPKHFLGKVAKFGGRSLYDFFKWGEPQESHGLNTVKFILLWCLSGARAPPFYELRPYDVRELFLFTEYQMGFYSSHRRTKQISNTAATTQILISPSKLSSQ